MPLRTVPDSVTRSLTSDRGRVAAVAAGAGALQLLVALAVAAVASDGGGVPWLLVVGAAVVAAVAAGAVVTVTRRDPQRVVELNRVLQVALAGDLTVATGSQRADALGDLERSVDEAVDRLRRIVGTVQQGLERFHADRLVVADVNKVMLDAAELTAGHAYDAGVSADQVSDSMHVVASSTEELVATVNEIAHHANVAADIAVTAAEQGALADNGVHELSTAVQQVESIAEVISKIAAQTHLLALNAMIEAARAGDAGRGFAVVAAEVKELSRATAEATEQVRHIVAGIHEGSGLASAAINQITETMSLIVDSTSSIASSVTEQTATTREIGRVSSVAADGASDISRRVSALHDRARDVAYVGASDDATKRKEFDQLEAAFLTVVDGFDVGDFAAQIDVREEVVVDQEERNRAGTTTADGVTSVMDYVVGDGLHEFVYTGAWLHGEGYETDPSGDAYCSVPGDAVEMRFSGRRLRFHGFTDQQQGMAEVWVEGEEPTLVDFYSPVRARRMLWESPELPAGEHVFHLRVSQKKNPESRYFWNSVAMVEVVH